MSNPRTPPGGTTPHPASPAVLAINVGSSSCKVTVAGPEGTHRIDTHDASPLGWDAARWRDAIAGCAGAFEPAYVLHRFVHGGGVFHGPAVITPAVRTQLESLAFLDPLHTAKALGVLDVLGRAFSGATAIACFDTTFHQNLTPAAYTYALPPAWRREYGVRKYGFHGFAHDYADARARELAAAPGARRVLSCHLGSGSSLAAIVGGASLDTTMGFTPVDGLVMSTRPGSIDPGALIWLLGNTPIGLPEMSRALEESSGLTALAGHGDMGMIMREAQAGVAASVLAYEVWLHRLVGMMGEMIAAMGGVDLIVFGGGIGERAWRARAAAAQSFAFLGLELDEEANRADGTDRLISSPHSTVVAAVISAREDLAMIRRTQEAGLFARPADPHPR